MEPLGALRFRYVRSKGARADAMLYWSFISFAVALISGLFGFGGSDSDSALLGQALFFVFLLVSALLVAAKVAHDHDAYEAEPGPSDGAARRSEGKSGSAARAVRGRRSTISSRG